MGIEEACKVRNAALTLCRLKWLPVQRLASGTDTSTQMPSFVLRA